MPRTRVRDERLQVPSHSHTKDQRRLASEGLTFSQLVDEIRLEMTVPKLRDPGIRLTDIALSLGYSDPAHFTRAFVRWAGVSPSEYRAYQLVS